MDSLLTKGRKKKTHKDKKALGIFLLKYLYEKGRPVELGEFFLDNLPITGMDYFQQILEELATKNWVIIKEETRPDKDLPFLQTTKFSYTISLDGIEYLSSLTMTGSVSKFIKNNFKVSVTIPITAILIGSIAYFIKGNNSVAPDKQKQPIIKSVKLDSSKVKK